MAGCTHPAIVNLLDAGRHRVIRQERSASGGPAQRVDTVTAVAFPAIGPVATITTS